MADPEGFLREVVLAKAGGPSRPDAHILGVHKFDLVQVQQAGRASSGKMQTKAQKKGLVVRESVEERLGLLAQGFLIVGNSEGASLRAPELPSAERARGLATHRRGGNGATQQSDAGLSRTRLRPLMTGCSSSSRKSAREATSTWPTENARGALFYTLMQYPQLILLWMRAPRLL